MKTLLVVLLFLGGCGRYHYVVPSDAADFRALGLRQPETAEEIAAAMDRKPVAPFPATLATARLQGQGSSSLIGVRTVETADDMGRLAKLPQVRGVVPLSRLVCAGQVRSMDEVRSAAANVRADLVLVYTFETTSKSETTIPVLGVLTLGIFPNEIARATSTGSAALVDTRTGYIYGLAETTAKEHRITNAWNTWSAMQKAEDGAMRRACSDLVSEVEKMWGGVLAARGPTGEGLAPH